MSRRPSRSSFGKDVEFQLMMVQDEVEYSPWWTRDRIFQCLHTASDNTRWNAIFCLLVLSGIIWTVMELYEHPYVLAVDIFYNVVYALHVLGIAYNTFITIDNVEVDMLTLMQFVLDFASFLHFVLKIRGYDRLIKSVCYYIRLHRPFNYLWEMNGYNLNGSVLGTTLKYMYIFAVLRIIWSMIWGLIDQVDAFQGHNISNWVLIDVNPKGQAKFLSSLYFVDKMFIPIGPSKPPINDLQRIVYMIIMITGCLVVTGAAVASLSLVISIYMRPEEAFRARYRLIMKEMNETNMPTSLRDKVQSFYKMYWHKQRAVSETELLKTFPPILTTLINTDIYFEATQRTRILCDLTFEFLSEVAKAMTTIHYIPGDAIIKRNTTKSALIFITYGDVEMVTAEDDNTAILRMTRGTMLSACAGGVPAGCGQSHVTIRAATFCTAHVLDAGDLWRVARKYGKTNEQTETILDCFYEHFDRVKKYHYGKFPVHAKYKSSILSFRSNLKLLTEAKDADGKLILSHPEIFLEIASSYIMRNRADAAADETDAICLKSTFPCILQPDSSLQVAWQIVVSAFALIAAVLYPYFLVFVVYRPPEFSFFDNVLNVINIIDVVVHLSTGAHVEEGVPINFSQTSSQQLRSIWFVLDVAAILPLLYFIGDGKFDGIQRLLKLPKVFRNLKSVEEYFVYHSNELRLISFTLLKLIFCYLIATVQQGFLCFQFGHCLVKNFTKAPQWALASLDDNAFTGRVSYGLYWAISVMTFTSHKEVFGMEKYDNLVYTILLLECCILLFIFIEAVYSATIMVTTFLRDDYDSTIANVKNFMIRNDVDPQMRKRFITYLELCWYTDKAYSMTNKKKSIFHDLPPHVYQEIVSRKRSKYILNIPFTRLLPKADLKTISSTARLFYTSPNEILMNTGDITNEMFVIKQGICEVINPDTREVVTTLTAKGHFGVLECLLRLPAYYTVRAITHVQVFSISKKKLGKMIDIPQIKYAVRFARNLPEYHNLQFRRDSFMYFEPPPPTPNRQKFRLPKKYELDTAFLQPFNRLGFLSVLRYVFPRFTIRPDGKYLQRYEWFRGICALLGAMVFPSYGYLELQWSSLYWFKTFLDVSAYFDMVQRLLVGYFNEMGILVYHPAATAAYYIKGAFIIDFLACAPLEFLESENRERERLGKRFIFRVSSARCMLRMNRLIQLYRLPSAINSLTGIIERRDIHLVIQAIPFFVTLLNVLTFYVIDYSVRVYRFVGEGWYIKPLSDKGGSWLYLYSDVYGFNLTDTPWNLHLAAYSWVVYEATTTGFNYFNPTNTGLMKVLFGGMIIGAMITTYYSVCIISIRANVNKELAGFQADLKDIMNFMRREELDVDLQKEVLSYYEYNWDKMGGVDYNRMLKLCDQLTLRTDAILHIYGPTFAKCPFLMQCDISLLRIMGREVRSIYLLRGMHVIDVDDVISDMYFLVYGQLQVRIFYEDRSMIHKLHRGSVFGNLDSIPTIRSKSTMVALSRIHILQIKSYNFHRILADFSKVQRLMKKHRGDNVNFIPGAVTGHRGSKDRTSTAIIMRGRKGLIKTLYFKDKYIQIYLILVSLGCVYADVYNVGFQNNTIPLIAALYLLDFGFYLKILIQFFLPYIVESENLKKVLLPMRKSYFKTDFRYDIITCLPIELFCLTSRKHRWMIFSWLRLNRLLRIMTVYKCLKRHHQRLNINLTLSTVFSVLIWFSLFIHSSGCIWYFIGTMEDKQTPKSSWLHSVPNQMPGNKTGIARFLPFTKPFNKSYCNNYYLCSVYFVLTTFTQNGVGDILPKKQSEVLFVCIFQIISTMVYMVYVGEFSNIIQYQSFRNFGYYCKCLELQHFLENNRVSRNLRNVVNKYALHLWREARGMQIPHFLASAPPAIKLKVMSAAYMEHIRNHLVFDNCERAFLRQLVGKLKMFYYNRDMFIVREGEITDCMYIVHTGRVVESSVKSSCTKVIMAGRSFGLVEGLIPETPFSNTYKTLLKSQILMLAYSDWNYLLKHFPKSAKAIYDHLESDDNSDGPPFDHPSDYHRRQSMSPWDRPAPVYTQAPKGGSSSVPHSGAPPGGPMGVPPRDFSGGASEGLSAGTSAHQSDVPLSSQQLSKQANFSQRAFMNLHATDPELIERRNSEFDSEIELGTVALGDKTTVVFKTPDEIDDEITTTFERTPSKDEVEVDTRAKYSRRASRLIDPNLISFPIRKPDSNESSDDMKSEDSRGEIKPHDKGGLDKNKTGNISSSHGTTPSVPSSESLQGSVELTPKSHDKAAVKIKTDNKGSSDVTTPSVASSESLQGSVELTAKTHEIATGDIKPDEKEARAENLPEVKQSPNMYNMVTEKIKQFLPTISGPATKNKMDNIGKEKSKPDNEDISDAKPSVPKTTEGIQVDDNGIMEPKTLLPPSETKPDKSKPDNENVSDAIPSIPKATEEIQLDDNGIMELKTLLLPSETKPDKSKPDNENVSDAKPSMPKATEDIQLDDNGIMELKSLLLPSETKPDKSKPDNENVSDAKPSIPKATEEIQLDDNGIMELKTLLLPSETKPDKSKPDNENISDAKPSMPKATEEIQLDDNGIMELKTLLLPSETKPDSIETSDTKIMSQNVQKNLEPKPKTLDLEELKFDDNGIMVPITKSVSNVEDLPEIKRTPKMDNIDIVKQDKEILAATPAIPKATEEIQLDDNGIIEPNTMSLLSEIKPDNKGTLDTKIKSIASVENLGDYLKPTTKMHDISTEKKPDNKEVSAATTQSIPGAANLQGNVVPTPKMHEIATEISQVGNKDVSAATTPSMVKDLQKNVELAPQIPDISSTVERQESVISELYPRPRNRDESSSSMIGRTKTFILDTGKEETPSVGFSEKESVYSENQQAGTSSVTSPKRDDKITERKRTDSEAVMEEELEELLLGPKTTTPTSIVKEKGKQKQVKSEPTTFDFSNMEDDDDINPTDPREKEAQTARQNRRLIRVRYEEDKQHKSSDAAQVPLRPITQTETDGDDLGESSKDRKKK